MDELSFSICFAGDGTDIETCHNANAAQAQSFDGVDPVLLALEKSSLPTAALHFVNLDDVNTVGVLRLPTGSFDAASPSKRFVSWTLGQNRESLIDSVSNWTEALVNSRGDENAIRTLSQQLFNLIVPENKKDARAAFSELMSRQRTMSAASEDTTQPPSLFVRWVRNSTDVPRVIPFGLASVTDPQDGKSRFLGFEFRIEQPLLVQSYQLREGCLEHWALAIPLTSEGDSAVQTAVARLGSLPGDWKKRAAGGYFETLDSLRIWFSDVTKPREPASVFAILGHHSKDSFYFDLKKPPFTVGSVKRTFTAPSVAILNACGTGGITASRFVTELNKGGFEAIIVTSSEVGPDMAADYMLCMREQLDGDKPLKNATLGQVHGQTALASLTKNPT